MNYYYITGTGKGIGKALAELLLELPDTKIIGFSRTNDIIHSNFIFVKTDLSNQKEVEAITFFDHNDAQSVSLINNAGILGPVNLVGNINPKDINEVINVNFISSFILTNAFIKKYQEELFQKIILNISSGAGRHPFESWSLYCSTKAALDMLSVVVAEEQKLFQKEKAFYVFSVAPGIVNTNMQTEIRNTPISQFPKLDTFVGYYENKLLSSPSEVALKLKIVLTNPEIINEVIVDVRNI